MKPKLKTLSLVKYSDFALLKYYKDNKVIEIPVSPSIFHFEYIDDEITAKDFINKYNKQMRRNCIADIVMFEIFQIQVIENTYNRMLDITNKEKEKVIKEFFKENMFATDSRVLQLGLYTYLQNNTNSDNSGYVN